VLEGWPEVADFNRRVMAQGWPGARFLSPTRNWALSQGVPEKVVLSLDYSPILGEDGLPAGVLAIVPRDHRTRPRRWRWLRSRAAFGCWFMA